MSFKRKNSWEIRSKLCSKCHSNERSPERFVPCGIRTDEEWSPCFVLFCISKIVWMITRGPRSKFHSKGRLYVQLGENLVFKVLPSNILIDHLLVQTDFWFLQYSRIRSLSFYSRFSSLFKGASKNEIVRRLYYISQCVKRKF